MATERDNQNPYSAFNFIVEIDGIGFIGFQEVSGLESENTPIEYREGADAMNAVRQVPGLEPAERAVFRRGVTGTTALWQWRKEIRDGAGAFPAVRNVTIQLQNERHENVYKWRLTNAWCCKLTAPTLNATGNEIAVETMELAYDRIDAE